MSQIQKIELKTQTKNLSNALNKLQENFTIKYVNYLLIY